MFAGLDTSRPWSPTGLSSATWRNVPVKMVRIDSLILTQDGVLFKSLLEPETPVGGDIYPHVVVWEGRSYLEDGHHRIVRAKLEKLDLISARVLYL